MDDKNRRIEIKLFLENESSQKFNVWLKNCFKELDRHYMFAALRSGIVYRFQKLEINKEYTNALIDPLYDNQTAMGECILLKWIEVGANLIVRINFPLDPRIINPLWDILFELCNDFPNLRDTVPHLVREIKNKHHFEIPSIPLPADAVQDSAAKPEKPLKPEQGSSIDIWFDYYHAMKTANYKMTFNILAGESGYSKNTFKAEHGRYKIMRETDIPNT